MFGKKDKDTLGQPQENEEELLSPFERLFKDVLDFYSITRQQLPKAEAWDYRPLFRALLQRNGGSRAIEAVKHGFVKARTEEISRSKGLLAELRSLLWQSIEQVCLLVETEGKQSRHLHSAQLHLQKALQESDLQSVRHLLKEVIQNLQLSEKDKQENLGRLRRSFREQLELLQSELSQLQKEVQLDGLTQVYNRAAFDQHSHKVQQLRQLTGQSVCLVMLDIDHFKKINDQFGHPVGDRVIQAFAKAILQSFPRKGDFVARYGGEEFAVILQNTSQSEVLDLVAKFFARIRALDFAEGFRITCSAGLAELSDEDFAQSWLERADKALYEAKSAGRDRYLVAAAPRNAA